MVLDYVEGGNLRNYFKKDFLNLNWQEKLSILFDITHSLKTIHHLKFIHKDLHSGNILCNYDDSYISDFGLSQSINNNSSLSVCGVLPYIAPEVLDKKPYTFASDVYSLGIIMVEMSTGKPPYGNVPHDEKLALAICNGLRPRVAKGTPKCYIDLVNQCLDANPENRPSAETLYDVISNWQYQLKKSEVGKEFLNADKVRPQESSFEIMLSCRTPN
jgi:serine/threonine protein kinase